MSEFRVPDSEHFYGYINSISQSCEEVLQKTSSFSENWKCEITSVYEFLQKKKEELDIMAKQIAELENLYRKIKSEIIQYKQKLEELKVKFLQLQQEKIQLENLLRQFESASSDDENARQMINEIRIRIEHLNSAISDVSEKISICITELEKLQQESAEIQAKYKILSDKYNTVKEHCCNLYDYVGQATDEFKNDNIPGKSQTCVDELNAMTESLKVFSNWMSQVAGWGVFNE